MMPGNEIILKGRLDGNQRNRLIRLLDMLYTPGELAREIGFEVRQVYRVYIPLGCPHEKDSTGRLWINGAEFRDWVKDLYQKRSLGPDEAFCLSCKKTIKMNSPEKYQKERLSYYLCYCPICGRKLARIITKRKRIDDQP